MQQCIHKLTLTEFMSQVLNEVKPNLLQIFKQALEEALLELRDRLIGSTRYQRGKPLKRWGFTIRKYLSTPLGRLEQVRIPRIRDAAREVRLFIDRYSHFSKNLLEQIVLAEAFNMSGRKLSVWLNHSIDDLISYPTLSKMVKKLRSEIERIHTRAISEDIQAIIVDGLWVKYRKKGKAVLLVALGVDAKGTIYLLDWQSCSSESTAHWLSLFRRLKERGLGEVALVTGDGSRGLPAAVRAAYPTARFQLCLWHLCRDMIKKAQKLTYRQRNRLYHDFWEVFNAFSLDECYQRYLDFLAKWGKIEPVISEYLARYENNLFFFYQFPAHYRHRLRTVNMAEGFFKHLRDFIKRFPGFKDENHLTTAVQLFLYGINKYRAQFASNNSVYKKGGALLYAY